MDGEEHVKFLHCNYSYNSNNTFGGWVSPFQYS